MALSNVIAIQVEEIVIIIVIYIVIADNISMNIIFIERLRVFLYYYKFEKYSFYCHELIINIILLLCYLQYSRTFLELFLRNAMPLLDSCLRMHNQEVVTLLKNLQTSTRLLQHVCTHSKVSENII